MTVRAPLRSPAPLLLSLALLGPAAAAQDAAGDDVEARLAALEAELADLRAAYDAERAANAEAEASRDEEIDALLDEIEALQAGETVGGGSDWTDRFSLGGYGEHHFTFVEGPGDDVSDIHRFVLYIGHRFSDRVRLHSETEIEHAYVVDDNGEVVIEQLYAEVDVGGGHYVKMGRVLAPLGIVNERHEPPTFNGVERPNVDKVIIPSTWSVDGVGLAGELADDVRYQLYAVGGLDGTGFDGKSGLRGGRIKERPSLNDVALTGRVDWFPLQGADLDTPQDLRVGASFFHGGYDNGNKGSDPGVRGDVTLLSADAEYSVSRFDFRGVFAQADISNADALNTFVADGGDDPGIADTIQGWYLEAAAHLMPESWRDGVLEDGDLVLFTRYEDYDTQHSLGTVATPDPTADRTDLTFGLGLFLTPNFVIKADYQVLDDASSTDRPDQVNLGFGYWFR